MHMPRMSWTPLRADIRLRQVCAQKNPAIPFAKMADVQTFKLMSRTLAQASNAPRHQECATDCTIPERPHNFGMCSADVAAHSTLALELGRSDQPQICLFSQYIDRLEPLG